MADIQEEIQELRQDVQDYQPGRAAKVPDRINFPESPFHWSFRKDGLRQKRLL